MIPAETLDNRHIAKLVRQYKTHAHSYYCCRNHSCRFDFPEAPSPHTLICRKPKEDDNSDCGMTVANACLGLERVYAVLGKPDINLALYLMFYMKHV